MIRQLWYKNKNYLTFSLFLFIPALIALICSNPSLVRWAFELIISAALTQSSKSFDFTKPKRIALASSFFLHIGWYTKKIKKKKTGAVIFFFFCSV